MPHDVVTHPDHDRERSLGWLAIAWMEYFLIHGPGDVGGEPVAPIIDEYCGFLVDTYALDSEGRRLYDHVFLSRPKGCAKSEVAANIGLFEGFGPCRFDGWAEGGEVYRDEWGLGFEYVYSPGEPMGKRVKNPYIRCVATEEGQAGLVYDTIYLNCTEGPLRGALNRRDDAGLTRILIPGGGEIVPSTSSAASKDGGKDTCTLFDETHLYNRPELRQTYKTLTRNLRKRRRSAGTFAVETTTMYAPGEDSIAEQTYKLIQDALAGKLRRHPRQLFDHRYSTITPEELDDEDKVRAALLDAYGDCALWNDIEGYIEAIADPRNDTVSSFRYWFNAPTSAENAWIAAYEWDGVGPENFKGDSILKPGDVIVLGFDGSRRRRRGVTDATALIACRVADGLISPLEVWAQPPGKYDEGWEVPEHAVEAKILWAFKTYKVIGFYADPAKWEANVAAWEAKYAKHLKVKASAAHPIEWWMTGIRAFRTVEALREFVEAMLDGKLHHDGDLILRAHVLNARRAETPKGVQIRKENPDSPNKIDAAVAAVLAWQARLDAIAKGYGTQRRRRVAVRM
ncbi:phage terminase family protein [Nocardia vinacea]|uniref:Phage terminase family protein n=1 Tax=Nocardia vinacea TaxID=96468 RepID=A0ABZ1YIL0_9NOCA|nr:hypothetical protein [Nocardia vinacea]